MSPRRPVKVTVEPLEAAQAMTALLEDYFAELDAGTEPPLISIVPIDAHRRGTVIYRVIQASRTIAERYPGADMLLQTEDGERWRLPPPAI
jgi:hypothetical protein